MEQTTQTDVVFTQAVNVWNQALGRNRDQTPYKQLIEAADRLLGERRIAVAVYKDDPDNPYDFYTLRYRDKAFEVVEHGKARDADLVWKVKFDYLKQVADDPQPYIERPERLDFDWLKSRLGL